MKIRMAAALSCYLFALSCPLAAIAQAASGCDAPVVDSAPPAQSDQECRAQWQRYIEMEKERTQQVNRDIRERRQQRYSPGYAEALPSIAEFLTDYSLQYGDIVYTNRGPRVFVGRAEDDRQEKDFVPLTSRRSPHRAIANELMRAMPATGLRQ